MKFTATTATTTVTSAMLLVSPAMSAEATAIAFSPILRTYIERRFQSEFLATDCKKMLEELFAVSEECEKPNWDGYGALPITSETYKVAYRLIETLPPGIAPFSIGAEPDGHITLEWYRDPRHVLSISIRSEGDLHYAALLGLSTRMGTEPFLGEVPEVVLNLISKTMLIDTSKSSKGKIASYS